MKNTHNADGSINWQHVKDIQVKRWTSTNPDICIPLVTVEIIRYRYNPRFNKWFQVISEYYMPSTSSIRRVMRLITNGVA